VPTHESGIRNFTSDSGFHTSNIGHDAFSFLQGSLHLFSQCSDWHRNKGQLGLGVDSAMRNDAALKRFDYPILIVVIARHDPATITQCDAD
jgi:hypothetical protein